MTLRWKVAEGKALGFKTSLQQVDSGSEGAPKIDMDRMIEMLREAAKDLGKEVPKDLTLPPGAMKEFFDSLKPPKEYSMTTVLKRLPRGTVSVLLVPDKGTAPAGGTAELQELLKKMEGTVQLRAEITESGAIESFWLQPMQKNLVALFFGLPPKPVRKGESWSLDVNLVQMGNGFVADKSTRLNRVQLAEIRKGADGEVTAVLDYILSENVEGEFHNPLSGKAQPTTMSMTFVGQGEFSSTLGAWKRFAGRMKMKATGFMTANQEQLFALEPLASVPEEYLKLR